MPSIDNEINIESAEDVSAKPEKKGFFKRLFSIGKKDKKEKKKTGLDKYRTSKK